LKASVHMQRSEGRLGAENGRGCSSTAGRMTTDRVSEDREWAC
jgi:hypothetical protein